jgi:hypothetical protein
MGSKLTTVNARVCDGPHIRAEVAAIPSDS